mmetsp:Transcript_29219/g.61497  ORF Transcript_29219/g.61497 Transcript_29219/m.61497 type:complete len:437 (-) Transcript_29219:291-1601(-)
MPKKPNFTLNLDGCRFGDSPPAVHHRRHNRQTSNNPGVDLRSRSENENNSKNSDSNHPSADRLHHNPNIHNLQFSPPPNQIRENSYYNDERQRNNGNHHLNHWEMMNQIASPLGTTYRSEGLSIGRDFLRFQGSTLSSSFCLDDLIVEECIGRGACSMVLKAKRKNNKDGVSLPKTTMQNEYVRDNTPNRVAINTEEKEVHYALKIFPMRDVEKRIMLLRELKVLCGSFNNCDCLVELEGAFLNQEEGTVTLVLEFMDRGSLDDLYHSISQNTHDATKNPNNNMPTSPIFRGMSPPLKKHKKLPERTIAAIAFQMIWGLAYLHHENTLHRDIKPANVLVSSSGRVKLADFGIVSQKSQQSESDDDENNMNVTVIGTTRYMSPERIRGKPYAMSSDVWSLGLVLLECVLGKSPFEDVSSVVSCHLFFNFLTVHFFQS